MVRNGRFFLIEYLEDSHLHFPYYVSMGGTSHSCYDGKGSEKKIMEAFVAPPRSTTNPQSPPTDYSLPFPPPLLYLSHFSHLDLFLSFLFTFPYYIFLISILILPITCTICRPSPPRFFFSNIHPPPLIILSKSFLPHFFTSLLFPFFLFFVSRS